MASDTSVRAKYVAWPHPLLPENDLKQLTDPFSTACSIALYPIFREVHGEGYFSIHDNVLSYSPKTKIPVVDGVFSYLNITHSSVGEALKRTWYGNGEWETRVISASIRILATYKIHDIAIKTLLEYSAFGLEYYANDRYGDRGGGALLRLTSKIIKKGLLINKMDSASPKISASLRKEEAPADLGSIIKTPQEERIETLLPMINEILKHKNESKIEALLTQVDSQQKLELIQAKDSLDKVQLDSLLTLFAIYSTLKDPGAIVMNKTEVTFAKGKETNPEHLLIFAKILKNALGAKVFPSFKELLVKGLIGVMEYQKKFCGKPSQVQALALSEVAFEIINKFQLNNGFSDYPETEEDQEEYGKQLTTLWQPSNFENVVRRIKEVMDCHAQKKIFKPIFDGLEKELSIEQKNLKPKIDLPFPTKEGKSPSKVSS